MHVVQIVSEIGNEASGPSYSVPSLCTALGARGIDVSLHVLRTERVPPVARTDLRVHPASPFLRRLGISNAMWRGLRDDAKSAQIVHNHGLWMMPNVYAGFAARFARTPLITSPRGTFSPTALRRSPNRKRALWLLGQGQAVRASDCFHATSEQERLDIRARGLGAPIAVIPNGIDIPPNRKPSRERGEPRRLLYFGRVHPIKGIDILLRAWSRLEKDAKDWELVIVGPDDGGYAATMYNFATDLGVTRVRFGGGVYGDAKWTELANADALVLPSHTENFGMVVAEALAAGTPTVVSNAAPWSRLEQEGCGWSVDPNEDSLTTCLHEVLSHSFQDLRDRGARGRAWMEREFSWERVGAMMLATYEWVLGGTSRPDWVHL